MALVFTNTMTATIKAKTPADKYITMSGVTTANITPAQAAQQMNKILALGGKSVVANDQMIRTQQEGVVDDE